LEKLVAVESFGWFIDEFAKKSEDKSYMEKLNSFINIVESDDALIAMSPHIIAVSRK
jgi:hypothetical protein